VHAEPMVRRTSLHLSGFSHVNPIPVASRVGPFLASGLLAGRDPETREMPSGLDAQCANVFRHVRALMAAAGGTTDDILKMTFWLADHRDRDALNREWLAMFPTRKAVRPASRWRLSWTAARSSRATSSPSSTAARTGDREHGPTAGRRPDAGRPRCAHRVVAARATTCSWSGRAASASPRRPPCWRACWCRTPATPASAAYIRRLREADLRRVVGYIPREA
jgi:2-iminobutanoate/2-iminopropanoate deaminase